MEKTFYAGTYTGTGSRGIYRFDFADGEIRNVRLFAEAVNPKYITMHCGMIAAAADLGNGAGVMLSAADGTVLDRLAFEKRTSCYIGSDGEYLYTANYHEGTFSKIAVADGRLHLAETVRIQDGAGCHQVLIHDERILVPCLFLDRVMMYDRKTLHPLGSIRFCTGTGPRHGVFSQDGRFLYLVSELSNEIFVISTADWEILSSMPVLKDGGTHVRGTAAIRLSENGRHVYVSTRGKDVISVLSADGEVLRPEAEFACGGSHPRDFALCGRWLLCANRFSGSIAVFETSEDGTAVLCGRAEIPEPVSLACAAGGVTGGAER